MNIKVFNLIVGMMCCIASVQGALGVEKMANPVAAYKPKKLNLWQGSIDRFEGLLKRAEPLFRANQEFFACFQKGQTIFKNNKDRLPVDIALDPKDSPTDERYYRRLNTLFLNFLIIDILMPIRKELALEEVKYIDRGYDSIEIDDLKKLFLSLLKVQNHSYDFDIGLGYFEAFIEYLEKLG